MDKLQKVRTGKTTAREINSISLDDVLSFDWKHEYQHNIARTLAILKTSKQLKDHEKEVELAVVESYLAKYTGEKIFAYYLGVAYEATDSEEAHDKIVKHLLSEDKDLFNLFSVTMCIKSKAKRENFLDKAAQNITPQIIARQRTEVISHSYTDFRWEHEYYMEGKRTFFDYFNLSVSFAEWKEHNFNSRLLDDVKLEDLSQAQIIECCEAEKEYRYVARLVVETKDVLKKIQASNLNLTPRTILTLAVMFKDEQDLYAFLEKYFPLNDPKISQRSLTLYSIGLQSRKLEIWEKVITGILANLS